MASSYEVIQQEIISSLVGRPAGTRIQPENHQQFALDLLDYIRSVEIIGASTLQGNANPDTVPVQPQNAKVSYMSSVPPGQTYVYTNFLDENGDPISVTSTANTVSLITLLWNGSFWSVTVVVVQLAIDYGNGYLFMGTATPITNPGTPDQNVFYIATTAGTYTNFGNLVVADGEVAILRYNGSWTKEVTGAATKAEVSALGLKMAYLVDGGTTSKQIYDHSTFAAASVELPSIITLSQVGDFIEFKVKTANENTNIVRNTASYNAPYIGYTGATTFAMRLIGQSGSSFSYQGNYISRGSVQVFKLVLTSITGGTKNFTLFVNGTERTTTTPPTATRDVTFAYAGQGGGANMDLYYIKGKSNGTDFYFDKFGEDTNVVGTVTDVYNTEQTTVLGLVKDEQDIATLQSQITDVEEGLEDVSQEISDLDEKMMEGGSDSKYLNSSFSENTKNIPASIGLSQVGDFIEFKANIKSPGSVLYRSADSYNRRRIGHSASDTLYVRLSLSVTPLTYQSTSVKENEPQVVRVELVSITEGTYNYDVYLDGTKIGTTTNTGAVTFDSIGHNITMDLYYLKNKSAGVETLYKKFAEMTSATDVTDNYATTIFDGLLPLNDRMESLESSLASQIGDDMYYRFVKNSTVWNMDSHFEIYQRLKGNYYLLTVLGLYTTTSDSYPKGYWRIEGTNLVTVEGGVVTTVEQQIITSGENEFVLQWLAGADYNASGGFTGGYHFGEKIDGVTGAWVEFIVDGNKIGISEDIPLTRCRSFFYREYSAIYNCHDNPASIAAWHLKETHFKDGGYETTNDVKFVQALDYFAYPGIVCVSRYLSEYAMPEGVATITDMGDGSTTIAEQFKSNGHRIHYEGNGCATDVFSEFRAGADDSLCQRVVYNSSSYNKYYRRNPNTAGSTDNRLVAFTKVTIRKM